MTEREILLTSILNCNRSDLYCSDLSLSDSQYEMLSHFERLRAKRIPLQHILGREEFFGLDFKVDHRVFIPRPETEILVEEVLRQASGFSINVPLKILDMGTGSGCIAVSIAKNLKQSRVTALDISYGALSLARENAALNCVSERIYFIQNNLFSALSFRFPLYDMIISNPPYIASGSLEYLQEEVKYEPRVALDGGIEGLDFYSVLIQESHKFLKNNGLLLMEMGFGQCDQIKNIFKKHNNFEIICVLKDYNDIDRVIVGRLKEYGKASN